MPEYHLGNPTPAEAIVADQSKRLFNNLIAGGVINKGCNALLPSYQERVSKPAWVDKSSVPLLWRGRVLPVIELNEAQMVSPPYEIYTPEIKIIWRTDNIAPEIEGIRPRTSLKPRLEPDTFWMLDVQLPLNNDIDLRTKSGNEFRINPLVSARLTVGIIASDKELFDMAEEAKALAGRSSPLKLVQGNGSFWLREHYSSPRLSLDLYPERFDRTTFKTHGRADDMAITGEHPDFGNIVKDSLLIRMINLVNEDFESTSYKFLPVSADERMSERLREVTQQITGLLKKVKEGIYSKPFYIE